SHTPPFRYDRYRLVVFSSPALLASADIPDYMVVDEEGRSVLGQWLPSRYVLAQAFEPWRLGWARVEESPFFVNPPIYVYARSRPGRGQAVGAVPVSPT